VTRGLAGALGAAAAGALLVGASGRALEAPAPASAPAELLYLPSGGTLRVASLGQESVLADLLYLWAIQYYSDYTETHRHEYVEKVFTDAITELDPRYRDAYWLGALIMSVEAKDLDAALRLLDKGIAMNPGEWRLPYLAGWECYFQGRYDQAAAYFEKAISVPGAPRSIRRASAGMFSKKGDVGEALARWSELANDPGMDDETRAIAARRWSELIVERDLGAARAAIAVWRAQHAGIPPHSLEGLVRAGLLKAVPVAPGGGSYRYDALTGEVLPPDARVLGPS